MKPIRAKIDPDVAFWPLWLAVALVFAAYQKLIGFALPAGAIFGLFVIACAGGTSALLHFIETSEQFTLRKFSLSFCRGPVKLLGFVVLKTYCGFAFVVYWALLAGLLLLSIATPSLILQTIAPDSPWLMVIVGWPLAVLGIRMWWLWIATNGWLFDQIIRPIGPLMRWMGWE